MKKASFILLFLLSVTILPAQQAKYVFYFIGDGMGVNQVQGTELYRGELDGKIGITPICFTQFPYATTATTFSATNGVTDSAAAGTALACGKKTKNGTIGQLEDQETNISSVAVWAKEKGCKVGIATSVSIDHATPAAFYAHNASRGNHYRIGKDLYTTGFDFYAGSDFLDPTNPEDPSQPSLYEMASQYKYMIARGYNNYRQISKKADKIILFQEQQADQTAKASIPYAIDRKKNDLTLSDITRAAIHFLSQDAPNGFFLMVEGGKIDWACHANDAATAFNEVIDMDEAIKTVYEFYSQHPDETLIVVTADHETGGLVLGTGAYKLNLQALKYQKVSENGFTQILGELRKKHSNNVSWEKVKKALTDNFGFWKHLPLSQEQEARLYTCYEKTFTRQNLNMEKSEYFQDEPLAGEAKRIINEIALAGWTSGGHSAGYVPVFAIGAGAEKFQGRMDNTEIPVKIAEAAGYSVR